MAADLAASAEVEAGACSISERRDGLARRIVDEHFRRFPALQDRYGAVGREKCVTDVGYTLTYLAEAVAHGSSALFTEYIAWVKVLFANLGIPLEDLVASLEAMGDVLQSEIGGSVGVAARAVIDEALMRLSVAPDLIDSFLPTTGPTATLAAAFLDALLRADRREASRLIEHSLDGIGSVKTIYLGVFQPVMREVGRLWHVNRISVAQEHFITASVQMVMSQLYPRIFSAPRNGRTLVAASVSGELHEIGIRMVADLFEMDGWNTYYLGANMPTGAVVKAVIERKADVVAISATITAHLPKVAEMIAAIRADECCRHVRIMVGGYPFNIDPQLWRRFGADGFAADCEHAAEVAATLLGDRR